MKIWSVSEADALMEKFTGLVKQLPSSRDGVVYFMTLGIPVAGDDPNKPEDANFRLITHLTLVGELPSLVMTSLVNNAPQYLPAISSQLGMMLGQMLAERLQVQHLVEQVVKESDDEEEETESTESN